MKLSKRIPARIKTIKFNWCKKDWIEINDNYRAIRKKLREPMDACFWCGYKFVNGDMMALAQPEKGKNKVLCGACADELLSGDGKDEK